MSKKIGQMMENFGLVYRVSGGTQIDVTVAREQKQSGFVDSSFCDHNCRIATRGKRTGNYECPAAFTRHPGLKARTMAEAPLLIEGIRRTIQGITMANTSFRDSGLLKKYFREFAIPTAAQQVIKQMFTRPPCEINLFGGNPECHPQILRIIAACKESGFIVNLTTTGGKLMYDENFLKAFLTNPPDILALSADDFGDVEQANELANLTMEEIRERWLKTSPLHGQKRKALEAAYAVRLAETQANFSRVLFNLVVHPGNIDFIESLINLLRTNFPTAVVNPYPAQSSFLHGAPIWREEHLPLLADFINSRIQEHMENKPGLVRRLQYWLMIKATMETYQDNIGELTKKLSGYGVWKCYETPGAGRYVKVGASTEKHRRDRAAGGHLACFWNSITITLQDDQVWEMEPRKIADYILGGMGQLTRQKSDACPGCIMPRLNFDMVSVELGMNPAIVPAYLKLRRQYVGF